MDYCRCDSVYHKVIMFHDYKSGDIATFTTPGKPQSPTQSVVIIKFRSF